MSIGSKDIWTFTVIPESRVWIPVLVKTDTPPPSFSLYFSLKGLRGWVIGWVRLMCLCLSLCISSYSSLEGQVRESQYDRRIMVKERERERNCFFLLLLLLHNSYSNDTAWERFLHPFVSWSHSFCLVLLVTASSVDFVWCEGMKMKQEARILLQANSWFWHHVFRFLCCLMHEESGEKFSEKNASKTFDASLVNIVLFSVLFSFIFSWLSYLLFSSSSWSLNWIAMNRSACSHDCISVYFYSREAISSATFTFSCSFLVDFPFTATGNLISLWFVMKRGRGTNCFSAGSKRSWRRSCQCERRWKVEEEVEVLVSQDANDLQDVIERSFRSFPSIHLLYVKRYSPVPVSGVLLCKSLQYFRERLTWCWSSYTLISVYDSKERVENERQREADDCTNIEGRITCYCREWDKSERKLQEGKK